MKKNEKTLKKIKKKVYEASSYGWDGLGGEECNQTSLVNLKTLMNKMKTNFDNYGVVVIITGDGNIILQINMRNRTVWICAMPEKYSIDTCKRGDNTRQFFHRNDKKCVKCFDGVIKERLARNEKG